MHVYSSAQEPHVDNKAISRFFQGLAKLPLFGLYHPLIEWMGSLLPDRSIVTRVDDFLSDLHSFNAGVPQGSVLSPVFFILFLSDLLSSTSASMRSFADDTFLSLSISFNPNDHTYDDIALHASISPPFSPMICQSLRSGVETT